MAQLTPEERTKKGLIGTGEVLLSAAMTGVALGAALFGGLEHSKEGLVGAREILLEGVRDLKSAATGKD